jgi:acyl dehydratase
MEKITTGFRWDELVVGRRYRTKGRTVTETDLVNFIGLSGLTEELFINAAEREAGSAIRGRVVPGALVYTFAEGLLASTMEGTGLAFLHMDLDVKGPTFVGDTLHVECEVVESRPTSKGGNGLVRTRNEVKNQHGDAVLIYTPLRMMRGSKGNAAE